MGVGLFDRVKLRGGWCLAPPSASPILATRCLARRAAPHEAKPHYPFWGLWRVAWAEVPQVQYCDVVETTLQLGQDEFSENSDSPIFAEIKESQFSLDCCKRPLFFNENSRLLTDGEHVEHGRWNTATVKIWRTYNAAKQICDELQISRAYIFIGVLWEIKSSHLADNLLIKGLSVIHSLLTAMILRELVQVCEPVTKYLQTRTGGYVQGLDINQALLLVDHEINDVWYWMG